MPGSFRSGIHDVRGYVDSVGAMRWCVPPASVVCTLSICDRLELAVSFDSCGEGKSVRCPVLSTVVAMDQSLRRDREFIGTG